MDDLIRREDAIRVVDSYIGTDPIVAKIKELPSAERVGHWSEAERKKSEIFYCSVCGGRAYHPWVGSRNTDEKNKCRYAYCPNCGARMKGEEYA